METLQFFEDYPIAWWFVYAITLTIIFGILFWIFTVDNTIPSKKEDTPFFKRFFGRSFNRKRSSNNVAENTEQDSNKTIY